MTGRTRTARLVGVLLATAVVVAACGGRPQELVTLDDDLAEAAAVAVAGDGVVDLQAVTDVDWDQLGVFSPYTPPADVERELGVRMPAAADRGMNSDSDVFLAFVHDGDLVAWGLLGRGRIASPPPAGLYGAEEATFEAEPWGDGRFGLTQPESAP